MIRRYHKKGLLPITTIIEIALITFAVVVILNFFYQSASKAEGAAADELCRATNVARAKTSLDIGSMRFTAVPRGCKTVVVDELPRKPADDKVDVAAQKEIANLMTKCWWMWLEGTVYEAVDNRGLFGSDEKPHCFVCSTFTLNKGVWFDAGQLRAFLREQPYTIKDNSDRCLLSGGGYCMKACDDKFPVGVPSRVCAEKDFGTQCCRTASKEDECVNKGGRCLEEGEAQYNLEFDGWRCSGKKKCFVDENTRVSYMNYIQLSPNSGYIEIDEERFTPGTSYAVVYVGDIKDGIWKTTGGRGVELLLGLAKKYSNSGILVSQFKDVDNFCFKEMGP